MEGGDEKLGKQSVLALMDEVDRYIPTPERTLDKEFLMPIEDVFTITGRGTVVTGRIEQGIIKVGEKVELVGIKSETADDDGDGRRDVPQAFGRRPGGRQRGAVAPRHRPRTTLSAAWW